MDEAGLPEEGNESLKVLHYLLEGHMSIRSDVGFVAITNHILDAAKSNRCVVLLREEPDSEEMNDIAWGVLFDRSSEDLRSAMAVSVGDRTVSGDEFSKALYCAYDQLIREEEGFAGFYGLRDFIYMLKSIKKRSTVQGATMTIELGDFVACLERNFSGKSIGSLSSVVSMFLSMLGLSCRCHRRHTMAVLKEALLDQKYEDMSTKPRFKLIIDSTKDDSIMRILRLTGLVDPLSALFKFSHMPEETEREKLRLIVGIKLAALQGNLAILSQTESINESFYDLFNQHFRAITRAGKTSLYSTIAVGGVSRRSRVDPGFDCILHIRAEDVDKTPSPFLNRFEKYSLGIQSVLEWRMSTVGPGRALFEVARRKVSFVVGLLGEGGLAGSGSDESTLNSIFLDMLPTSSQQQEGGHVQQGVSDGDGNGSLVQFASTLHVAIKIHSGLSCSLQDVISVIKIAQRSLESMLHSALDEILLGKVDMGKVGEAVDDVWSSGGCETTLGSVCAVILRMVMVRAASFRVLQLATPEAIFSKRYDEKTVCRVHHKS